MISTRAVTTTTSCNQRWGCHNEALHRRLHIKYVVLVVVVVVVIVRVGVVVPTRPGCGLRKFSKLRTHRQTRSTQNNKQTNTHTHADEQTQTNTQHATMQHVDSLGTGLSSPRQGYVSTAPPPSTLPQQHAHTHIDRTDAHAHTHTHATRAHKQTLPSQ